MMPFLKWPGGKRWFISQHSNLLPSNYNRYIEPFLGSGAVFFHLEPVSAILGDSNEKLIALYQGIRNNSTALEKLLQFHQLNHSNKYYYTIRDLVPTDPIEHAAQIIYLNRTCFNGIYRVNLKGKFNVPKGTRDSVILPTDNFRGVSDLLKTADIHACDFETLIEIAERKDFVFADPPYTTTHNLNGFVKYNEKLFSWDDQVRLANCLSRARGRGVMVIATNANHPAIRALYNDRGFTLQTVSRFSSVSASAENRKLFEELIILS